jgi:hypothetical protein
VVVLIDEVLNVTPVPNEAPPVGELYHDTVPTPVAESDSVPVPHLEAPVVTGGVAALFMLAITGTRVLEQPPALVASA